MSDAEPTPWDRVSAYAESIELDSPATGYGDIGNALAKSHPPGYARCYAVWWADADIANGGFHQFFHNSTGDLVLLAIDCFEHIGADKMVAIFKSALYVCNSDYLQFIRYEIPADFFANFEPLSSDLDDLSTMYYEEKYKLPGKTDDTCYYDDFVAHYWDARPEEFEPKR